LIAFAQGPAERHGIALPVVTHDVDEALYPSDRVRVIGNRPGTVCRELQVGMEVSAGAAG